MAEVTYVKAKDGSWHVATAVIDEVWTTAMTKCGKQIFFLERVQTSKRCPTLSRNATLCEEC